MNTSEINEITESFSKKIKKVSQIKKNQVDILGLKNTITKIKITPQMSPRVEQTEQRICEHKEKTMEVI